ncbi:MAG TPA: hypothetical protein VNY51_02455 [Candidatus Dormibacteraeota bacterium]|jgi:hypothetical protein|nr:hypothetical protein [Candidatus Dormibacteraeota bacterium]
MNPVRATRCFMCAVLALSALFLTKRANASAADFYQSSKQAKVLARLPLSSGGSARMFLRQEGKTRYLYVQRASQQGVTVIDVTKARRPKVVHRAPLETLTVMGSGLVVTETLDHSATLSASGARNGDGDHRGDVVPESVHVLDVRDPAHSRTVGSTSVLEDPARNLVYVVNDDGIWILSRQQGLRGHKCSSSDAISPIPNCN